MRQPSRQGIALFSVRIEFWRSTGHASSQLKTLLETKHLYQKVDISPDEVTKKMVEPIKDSVRKERLQKWCEENLNKGQFTVGQEQLYKVDRSIGVKDPLLTLKLPHVSLFCKKCGRREAFAPVWSTDSSQEIRNRVSVGQKAIAIGRLEKYSRHGLPAATNKSISSTVPDSATPVSPPIFVQNIPTKISQSRTS
jgi:hypothetical protein